MNASACFPEPLPLFGFGFSCADDCVSEWGGVAASVFLTGLIGVVGVGLALTLFAVVVIGWHPDLYNSAKHIFQARLVLSRSVFGTLNSGQLE